MNSMNTGVSFKAGDFIALRCKIPEAFLIVQAQKGSPDPITLQQQPQIKIPFRWYKRSLSYENGSDLYTPGRNDEIMYRFIICTVNMKRGANSEYILEPAERYSILRTLREILLQDDNRVDDNITPTSDVEHSIFGMVPLGVVARTVLNGSTFYLVIWKDLGNRYTWESKKFIDENCDGPLLFNESSSRIITFNLGQQLQPPPQPQGVQAPGQMPLQRFPQQPPMRMPGPIAKQQIPGPYQQQQQQQQPQHTPQQIPPPPPPQQHLPPPPPPPPPPSQHRLTPPDPKKLKQEP